MQYIEYVNIVLQAINEVPLTSTQFANTRGLQQFAKESINRTYFDIVGETQWPWMQADPVQNLGIKELSGEYSVVPLDIWTIIPVLDPYKDAIDWSTIYYRDNEGTKVDLPWLSWEQYEQGQRNIDEGGLDFVVQSADGRSIGLPGIDLTSPGKLFYRVWTRPSLFVFATDLLPIPDMHYNVLVDGALHHMWSFRGNIEQAQLAGTRYEAGIKRMKQKYRNQTARLTYG